MDEPIREDGVEFDIKKTKQEDDVVVGSTDPITEDILGDILEKEDEEEEDALDMEEADPFGDRFEE